MKILDYHGNDWILYACLAVTTILAIAFSIALIVLIVSKRKLRNDLVDSPRGQEFEKCLALGFLSFYLIISASYYRFFKEVQHC